ncbi:MAG: hypothetical protein FJZ49_06840 [Candidatus Verstraetearchaeota archaeon]|nr:hypothetical protein [Candidatus Verstraetearchaeota archaeon]
MITNRTLTTIAWGAFVILLGLIFISESYGVFFWFGVGLILICLNVARHYSGIRISKFTFFIGIIAFIGGFADVMGYRVPLLGTILIVIGLFIIGEMLAKRSRR